MKNNKKMVAAHAASTKFNLPLLVPLHYVESVTRLHPFGSQHRVVFNPAS